MKTPEHITQTQEPIVLHSFDEIIFPVFIGLLVILFLKAIWPAFATFLYRFYLKNFSKDQSAIVIGNPREVYSVPPQNLPITYGLPIAEINLLEAFAFLLGLIFIAIIGSSNGLYQIGLFFTSPMILLGCFIYTLIITKKGKLLKNLFLTYGTLFSLKSGFIICSIIIS